MAEADPPKLQVVANSASRIFFAGVEIDVGRFPDYGFGARVVSTSGPTGHHFLRWMASNSLSTREYAVRLDREDRSFQPIHAIPGDRTQGLVLANTSGAPNRVVYFRVDGGAFSPYEWPIGDYLKLKVTAGPTVTFVSANGTDDFPYPEIVIEGTAVASGAFLRLYFEAYLGYYFTLGAIGQPALRGHYHLLVDGVYQYKKTVSLWSTSGTIRYYLGRLPLGTTGFRLSFHNSGTNANHSSFTTFDIPISGTEVAFHQSLHDGEIILRT
jgi:hypothetical protein